MRYTSQGRALTTADIVANREVDKHAKAAAESDRLPAEDVKRVRGDWQTIVAIAMWIGKVSAEAQRHDVVGDPVARGHKRLRDSVDPVRRECCSKQSAAAQTMSAPAARPDVGDSRGPSARVLARRSVVASRAHDERQVACWLRERAPGMPSKRKAAEILEEVARRIRARGNNDQ